MSKDITAIFITIFFLSIQVKCTKDIVITSGGPIVSPIGPQSVIVEGKINIFFSAVGNNIAFSCDNLPNFAEMVLGPEDNGVITISTSAGDEGTYIFHLKASCSTGTIIKTIQVEVMPIVAGATVYYSDPKDGSMSYVGDASNPWGSLQEIFDASKTFNPGDVIFCKSGFHGIVNIVGDNVGYVNIAAQSGHFPTVQSMFINDASYWRISGLDVSPEHDNKTSKINYVNIESNTNNITVENCKISSINDADVWTTNDDWYVHAGNGIVNKGEHGLIRNNLIKNTYFSAVIEGDDNRFEYNTIDRFGGDGVRAISDDVSICHNVIKNAIVSDYSAPGGNHDDAFQSWTFNEPIEDVSICGNQIFNYTDPDIPLISRVMQGIADFDGFEENWVIENNLVVLDHPHGIALYGAKDCKVINNTVIRNPYRLFDFESDPWITIHAHKDGRPSTGNLVRNNIAGVLLFENNSGLSDYNMISTDYDRFFVDYKNWDFHLKPNPEVIDAGNRVEAPMIDNDGFIRSHANPIDLGCFEKGASLSNIKAQNH